MLPGRVRVPVWAGREGFARPGTRKTGLFALAALVAVARDSADRRSGGAAYAIRFDHRLIERLEIRIRLHFHQEARGCSEVRDLALVLALAERVDLLLMLLVELVVLAERRQLG